ncbi:MAG: hypothetical protein A2167_07980 [Planctomycetes bacterium RBG_13_46_10]|nr:MAG: hypothetical protein A2167_07980 [Planctomycetes bacterium RBG_13_46_10]
MKNELFPNYKTIHRLILVMVALVLGLTTGLASVPVFAADEKNINKEKGNPVPENIGFMENPPRELKEKFPMCDAFLNVEWINKEKKIGYSNYEVIIKGKKTMMWALVTLNNEVPSYDWDVYQYKREGRLKEIFEMLKYGEDKGNIFVMTPTYNGKSVKIHQRSPNDDDSFADHRCTVCIPYPDKKRVWIAEGKSVKQFYSAAQRKELSDRIKDTLGRSVKNEWLESLWILDVNFDGKEDFVRRDSFVVTWSNRLYLGNRVYKDENVGFQYTFPPNGRTCYVKSLKYPLTTDGRNYYIANQCNLTELTSQ